MLKKLIIQPGVVKTNTDYAVPGRYVDSQWVRFVGGGAEKMGGWAAAISDTLAGRCRSIREWLDNSGTAHVTFGTSSRLYVLTGGTLVDITPFRIRFPSTITNALDTVDTTVAVTVNHVGHGQQVGDTVSLEASAAVGGLTISGTYVIQSAAANSYVINASSAATSTVTGGGGTIAYGYTRVTLGANPFTTASGSNLVSVADGTHGSTAGSFATFSGAAAVGGLTISGTYPIDSITDADTYVIEAPSNASSTATGGGASVTVRSELNHGATNGTDGTPVDGGAPSLPRIWSLAQYGQWLLANPRGGQIYMWDPSVGGRAVRLHNSPSQCDALFVTSERYIVALGISGDNLQLGWPDQLDPTMWTAALANTANPSRKIQGGNYIVSGGEVRNQASLIWTDTSVFLHQWRADDFVFSTVKIADGCGLFGPNAFTVLGEVAYWVGDGQFWYWDGAINELPSDDVREWFFENVDRTQRAKVFMGRNAALNELIIFYQETGQSENNAYLLYNVNDKIWAVGTRSRTAWADRGLFPYPIATDAGGDIFNHEIGVDGAGTAINSFITAAPVDITEIETVADSSIDILGFLPDIEGQVGDLTVNILTRETAMDTPSDSGPNTLTTAGATVDLRLSGQMAGFKLASNVIGGNFRLGTCRVEVQPGGARRG